MNIKSSPFLILPPGFFFGYKDPILSEILFANTGRNPIFLKIHFPA